MGISLKPGSRVFSNACDAEFIAIKAPDEALELTIGGCPAAAAAAERVRRSVQVGYGGGSRIGKRFVDADGVVELLCIKPGEGVPALGGQPLSVKDSKTLPASD